MKPLLIIPLCLTATLAVAQVPQNGPAISSRDRVYTADQTSNTVSVIDPLQNKLLGVIPLGKLSPKPSVLSIRVRSWFMA